MMYFLSIIGLEFLALLLAWLQSFGGVRTDEAKILLNIPYPHPPLLRWIIGQTEWLPFQEMLWRALLASLVVQTVWLVWKMSAGLTRGPRLLACISWLSSGAVLLQAGTITTAPVTAIFGLVFCWFLLSSWKHPSPTGRGQGEGLPLPSVIALLWLLSLFTAYQAVLYLPVVVAVLRKLRVPWRSVMLYVGCPIALVGLYVLTHPLSLNRFVDAGTLNIGKSLFQKFADLGDSLVVAGSFVGALLGVYGMVRARSFPLLLSFLLVCTFVFVSFRSYYAILFTPLFTGGVILLLRECPQWWKHIGIAYVLSLLFLCPLSLDMTPSSAREVMQELSKAGVEGEVLINGSFGHEWQYESSFPIRKYRPKFLERAGAVICLDSCDSLSGSWRKLEGVTAEIRIWGD